MSHREVLSLGDALPSVSFMDLSSNLSLTGDVYGGVVNVCSDVDDDTDVKLLLLVDRADVSSSRDIDSITSVEQCNKLRN